ncbi:MAG: single-stranded-DNA-specific exonuclease RecJ [Myxococcales bacterium]|nr:single-stranded-DNA-specific exonuclease RecJ [Myxococcales bacterium]
MNKADGEQATSGGGVRRVWVRRPCDERVAEQLCHEVAIDPRIARLLVARGISTKEEAKRFLEPKLEHLPHPFLMKDLKRAAERVADAVINQESVCLYGDYDVDGVTSSSLLAEFLGEHGLEPEIYIPKRLREGYGLNQKAIEGIAQSGARLLVTLDCGITAADEISQANDLGLACIIVDHHRCPPVLPNAVATLNPHQPDCKYPDKGLAAVGVTYNLIIGVRKVLRERGYYSPDRPEPHLLKRTDLVALGTIADMVPLMGVNRVLTHYGLKALRLAERPGARALMEVSKVIPSRINSGDVGFKLGPRINAVGRLDDATVGVRLLLAESIEDARPIAQALDEANGERRRIEGDVYESSVAMVEKMVAQLGLPDVLVLGDPTWHAGVVGIVASKLVERYDRPTILVGEGGRGSGRTARGLHLYDAMRDCQHHLIKFGGHRAAAGLRMRYENLTAFRDDLTARSRADPSFGQQTEALLDYDDDLSSAEIDFPVYEGLQQLEPFGNANPQPVFRVAKMRVREARVVGHDHLKLRLEGEHRLVSAMAFRKAELSGQCEPGVEVCLAASVELNEYQGHRSVELRVRDLRIGSELLKDADALEKCDSPRDT